MILGKVKLSDSLTTVVGRLRKLLLVKFIAYERLLSGGLVLHRSNYSGGSYGSGVPL